MKKVLPIYKPVGTTPFGIIRQIREKLPEYSNAVLGYAGRLDPMAEGVLLVLVGEENKQRKQYEKLPKKYEFEILFGVETDTYDPLGIVENTRNVTIAEVEDKLPDIINELPGELTQPYPPYSSARYNGKPLFYWARAGKIQDIPIPAKKVTIYNISLHDLRQTTLQELVPSIQKKIRSVQGDFRQSEILDKWKTLPDLSLVAGSCSISCSSGLYVRSLVHDIGQKISVGALALSIKRVKVGTYDAADALNL